MCQQNSPLQCLPQEPNFFFLHIAMIIKYTNKHMSVYPLVMLSLKLGIYFNFDCLSVHYFVFRSSFVLLLTGTWTESISETLGSKDLLAFIFERS